MSNYLSVHKAQQRNSQYIGPNWITRFEFYYQSLQLEVNKRLAAFNNWFTNMS